VITTLDRTGAALALQLVEPTGAHILDSGGTSGRGWQRRAGMSVFDFEQQPETVIDDYGCVTVSSFHFFRQHADHTPRAARLTASFREYVEEQPQGDAYYNSASTVEEWLELHGLTEHDYSSDNTYNYDSVLSNVWQAVMFTLDGVGYTALASHNGADVRGGYSDFVVYESCEYWLAQIGDAALFCRMCSTGFYIRGGYELEDNDGIPYDGLGKNGACPKCGWCELVGDSVAGCVG